MATEDRERREALDTRIRELLWQGRRVESQLEFSAVLIRGQHINHALHFILVVLTAGFWGFDSGAWVIWIVVWLALVFFAGVRKELVLVDESGNVSVRQCSREM